MSCLTSGNGVPENPTNAFLNLITPQIQQWYVDLIDELISNTGATTLFELTYLGDWIECTACNAGVFKPGGTEPYYTKQRCLVCSGTGKIQCPNIDRMYLCAEFNAKKFRTLASKSVNSDKVDMEIMGRVDILPAVLSAESITIIYDDCPIPGMKYIKNGGPEYCGLSTKDYFRMAYTNVG